MAAMTTGQLAASGKAPEGSANMETKLPSKRHHGHDRDAVAADLDEGVPACIEHGGQKHNQRDLDAHDIP